MAHILSNEFRHSKKHLALKIATTLFVVLIIFVYFVFNLSGRWLVKDVPFDHVKWVAVLDGQNDLLDRNDFAIDLIRHKKADSVVVLGRQVFRTRSNAEFYADDFMQQVNIDGNALFLARHNDPSTMAEARTLIPWFKSRNADTVLVITYTPASKRAYRIFNTLAGGKPVFITADIKSNFFDVDSWYTNREASKLWLREWSALIMSYFELWNADPLTAADSSYFAPIRSYAEEHMDFE